MAAKMPSLRGAGLALCRDLQCKRTTSPLSSCLIRFLATGRPPPKPRPYASEKPLVSSRSKASQDALLASAPPQQKKGQGVVAPYWRLSLGVVLIGSIVYSMVAAANSLHSDLG